MLVPVNSRDAIEVLLESIEDLSEVVTQAYARPHYQGRWMARVVLASNRTLEAVFSPSKDTVPSYCLSLLQVRSPDGSVDRRIVLLEPGSTDAKIAHACERMRAANRPEGEQEGYAELVAVAGKLLQRTQDDTNRALIDEMLFGCPSKTETPRRPPLPGTYFKPCKNRLSG